MRFQVFRSAAFAALLFSTPFLASPLLAANPASPSAAAPRPGALAPDFTLPDAAGKHRSLSEFRGKWVVLEWVNYDCPFVKKHYGSGNMQKLQKASRAKGAVWLSINSSAAGKQGHFEGEELAKRIRDAQAQPDAYLVDADGKVGKSYKAKTTPSMFVIDPAGTLLYKGAIDDTPSTDEDDVKTAKNYVRQALTEAMAGKPVSASETKAYGCSVKYK